MPKKLFKKRRWRAKAKSDHNGKRGLSFSSKIVSTDGVICLVLGIICLIMLIAAVVISTLARGINFLALLIYLGLYAYGLFIGMV